MKTNMTKLATLIGLSMALALPMVSQTTAAPFADEKPKAEKSKHHKAKKGKHHRFKRLAKALELTDEQKAQAKTIHENAKDQMDVHKASLKSYREELKAIIAGNDFDSQAILDLRAKYKFTFDQIALIKAKEKYDFLQLLTPEQKDKLQKMMEKRHQRPPVDAPEEE
jgi:protein CpxP